MISSDVVALSIAFFAASASSLAAFLAASFSSGSKSVLASIAFSFAAKASSIAFLALSLRFSGLIFAIFSFPSSNTLLISSKVVALSIAFFAASASSLAASLAASFSS